MCGIAGILNFNDGSSISFDERMSKMLNAIAHRGPDSNGVWSSKNAALWLGHRRLAIQDLSPLGHQPMMSSTGRYILVFNGEIYNFKRLAKELIAAGFSFRGHSDTEVMLAAFEHWGVEDSLRRMDGMFAFAVVDLLVNELWIARDRMGEKPLYYSVLDGEIVFCSELKGLLVGIGKKLALDWRAIGSYFRFGYFPVLQTPFTDVRKLKPGSYVKLDLRQPCADSMTLERRTAPFWENGQPDTEAACARSEADIRKKLEYLLIDAVKDQAVADVDIGVFLSGGIDSTLVAALLQKNSVRPVKTYTIAFDHKSYNEGPFAREIAQHLGTHHTEIPVSTSDCLDVVGKLPTLLDEPFADASLLPSYIVCREARKHVTVCLSGDGGDELFGGYNRYSSGEKLWSLLERIPIGLRIPLAKVLNSCPERVLNALYAPVASLVGLSGKKPEKDVGSKIHKIARALPSRQRREFYVSLLSFWHESPLLEPKYFMPGDEIHQSDVLAMDFVTSAMHLDQSFYLVADNLFKSDRASMAASLEVRLPLLDRAVVEYAACIPRSMKIEGGQTKKVLRDILYQYVPRSLMDRPKMGFSVPISDWLRRDLRGWAEGLLQDCGDLGEGLDQRKIMQVWLEHQSGHGDNANALWTVFMYLEWMKSYKEFVR